MNELTCEAAQELILDLPAGVEPTPGLTRHLAGCNACAAVAATHRCLADSLPAMSLTASPRVWDGIQSRLGDTSGPAARPVFLRAILSPRIAAGFGLAGAFAALLFLWPQTGVEFHVASGRVLVGDRTLPAAGHLVPGPEPIRVETGAELVLAPVFGDRLAFPGPSTLRVSAADHVDLLEGRGRFELARGKGGFTVSTAFCTVRVLGTVFTVAVADRVAEIFVSRGHVEVATPLGEHRTLSEGESLRVTGSGLQSTRGAITPDEPPASPVAAAVGAGPGATVMPGTSPSSSPAVTSIRPGPRASGGF